MLTKVQNAFEKKIFSVGRQGQLYIVPTLDGLKLLFLNIILLIIGLVYANNFVLLFNFILFCLFLGSMFYTHFNLKGLKLVSTRMNPIHAGEQGTLSFTFKSNSTLGHYFLVIKLKNKNIKCEDAGFTFSLKENEETSKVEVSVESMHRGVEKLSRISLETKFPFHLFRAFAYFNSDMSIVVYPEMRKLDLHETLTIAEEKNGSEDDFYLKNYHPGDPLKRVHWKKYAQTGKLFTKQMTSHDAIPVMLGFSRDDLTAGEKEIELSSICFGLHELHSQSIYYGLALDNLTISPDHSHSHLSKCLKVLAEYET